MKNPTKFCSLLCIEPRPVFTLISSNYIFTCFGNRNARTFNLVLRLIFQENVHEFKSSGKFVPEFTVKFMNYEVMLEV